MRVNDFEVGMDIARWTCWGLVEATYALSRGLQEVGRKVTPWPFGPISDWLGGDERREATQQKLENAQRNRLEAQSDYLRDLNRGLDMNRERSNSVAEEAFRGARASGTGLKLTVDFKNEVGWLARGRATSDQMSLYSL